MLVGGTSVAQAAAPPEVKPCQSIATTFATANIQMDLPEPIGQVAGPLVQTVCGVTG
jgi:hypothetical protein